MVSEQIDKAHLRNYVQRLICKKNALFEQLNNEKLIEIKQINLGEVKGIDLIIKEMIKEFDLSEDDFEGL
ncbi:hypothetical protein N0O92_13530 [Alkalihalobacillus sp. MEB130]|uniref:hypothetical protein n=1 Tax=Alkalihalobacillus sp. MEB130 TaxID=2976704 RepID=UPI0028DE8013|nr:hypothetical protein [Alkalihalobacillus sp. MEB130]MDT8861257.1 hypothetical protein [Alkalihalobacillus sp. MEB130]